MKSDSAAQILIIEDDPDGLRSVADAVADAGHQPLPAPTAEAGLRRFQAQPVDAVLCDIRLPDLDGRTVLERLRALDPDVPVLLMTAYGGVADAVAALQAGAYDYLLKPLDLSDLQSKVAHAVETRRLRAQLASLRSRLAGRPLIAVSAGMRAVLQQARAVAPTHATVLILGESGTGKELVARALHEHSPRAAGPFIAVHCGALADTLLESELFGHEKGAFTGAYRRHAGAFERAHGGTLFLDEIGSAPPSVQTRLLRALEAREIVRVGGGEPTPLDVRVVAASNRDLEALVAERAFRNDLLFRLKVVTLTLPPLRERRDDIRPLADHFVAAACLAHGRRIDRIEPGYYAALERHAWPGNVRELKHAVESSVILADAPRLAESNLVLTPPAGRGPDPASAPPGRSLAELERWALHQALTRHGGSRTLAAAELGISARTIQRKIQEYRLPF